MRLVAQPEGLLQVHTAPFRGSFGSVLSQALRTAGLGSRVLVSQFLGTGTLLYRDGAEQQRRLAEGRFVLERLSRELAGDSLFGR